eukprot:365631-Chlamydomonas_euryale.AAC.7
MKKKGDANAAEQHPGKQVANADLFKAQVRKLPGLEKLLSSEKFLGVNGICSAEQGKFVTGLERAEFAPPHSSHVNPRQNGPTVVPYLSVSTHHHVCRCGGEERTTAWLDRTRKSGAADLLALFPPLPAAFSPPAIAAEILDRPRQIGMAMRAACPRGCAVPAGRSARHPVAARAVAAPRVTAPHPPVLSLRRRGNNVVTRAIAEPELKEVRSTGVSWVVT